MTNNEELKPCPFCGSQNLYVRSFGQAGLGSYEETHGPVCQDCLDINRVSVNEWQNAYCWKELDKLKAENEALKMAATITDSSWRNLVEKNQRLREALVVIEVEANREALLLLTLLL